MAMQRRICAVFEAFVFQTKDVEVSFVSKVRTDPIFQEVDRFPSVSSHDIEIGRNVLSSRRLSEFGVSRRPQSSTFRRDPTHLLENL
jgi:hypothetical protein